MTNNDIIWSARVALVNAGKLGTTGRMLEYRTADGETHTIAEPEEIHTFAAWKARGFIVKRGEHSDIKLKIWKHKSRTITDEDGNEQESSNMFLTTAYFFTPAQVEPLNA